MPLAPEYAAMFAAMAEQPGSAISEMTPAQAREVYRMMRPANPDLTVGTVADATCPGQGDQSMIGRVQMNDDAINVRLSADKSSLWQRKIM